MAASAQVPACLGKDRLNSIAAPRVALSALVSRLADRCGALEEIALVLRTGALADPFENLAAWVAGVEVIKGLKRAGFTVAKNDEPIEPP